MPSTLRILLLGSLAMIAFAANSVLARFALVDGASGAWSFTLIRLISGALALALMVRLKVKSTGSWKGAASLLIYVAGFSYAYLALGAGFGALVLFAVVQFTMVGWAMKSGERLSALQWAGLIAAFGALVWLLSPSLSAPSSGLAILSMMAAGMGWGAYSLIGRSSKAPTHDTSGNFLRASLIALLLTPLVFVTHPEAMPGNTAIAAALASGIITSGIGYAIWYGVLPALGRAQAGILQLTVPAIAALGGVLFLSEPLTLRLALSAAVILGGVGLATLRRKPR
ncbi:DMT family transporter [Ponticaulis sp.]|uniref:DMT family transporter n=1 Tax=Ponticaulis sp. TaxID=2020902 RepID=UPI000B661C04|nr:DMT family transporter [Ponticaulis sp.]MAJ07973.1 EamA family transporter [Ponticaulis sp.]RPG18282.1 MAG: DMT family transporter [Hyphomonadaceae bacterium TMED125]HBH88902.1 EamA family transporter [Hyphomonadaceae bacterium]|tara:strand:- start:1358 stop:2206 length:849 start_codon:yes stop_codon:yes gene_type:complete